MGRSGFQLSLTVNSQKKIVAISFEINTDNAEDNKKYFDILKHDFEAQAASAISDKLSWQRLDGKRVSLVQLSESFDFLDSTKQAEQFAWFIEYVNKFIKFFKPKIKNLQISTC